MRPDYFDYDAAHDAVKNYHAKNIAPLFEKTLNPFNLDPSPNPEDNEQYEYEYESCCAFLYVRVDSAHFLVY